MADDTAVNKKSVEEKEVKKIRDPEFLSCLLQPPNSDADPNYVGIRRFLIYQKAVAGVEGRKDWKCNGKGYVSYRNYIRRPKNWESMNVPSGSSTPGQSGRWVASAVPHSILYELDSFSSSRDLRESSQARTSFGSTTSDTGHLLHKVEPAYSFVGMHCIFDNCKTSVTVLKFGHMNSDLLAYGASNGTLTVCSVSQPPSVIKQLKGHSKDVTASLAHIDYVFKGKRYNYVVNQILSKQLGTFRNVLWVSNPNLLTDFDFSSNNQYIASSSLDKTVRVWEISKGYCIRVIYGVSSQLCIRFHPVNNNFLSVGNTNREITVINFSTGRIINKATFENEITALDNDHTGQLIFCGDAQGSIYTVNMNSHTGAISRSYRSRSYSKHKSPITTMQYSTFSLLARGPVLLACAQDGNLSFFSVASKIHGYLTLRCSLKLAPRVHPIRASFCPLLSLERGEFIVAGSEDSNVYFYDLTRPKHACVNKLQGHGCPVIGIAWNHGENLLASSDSDGTVIVWKRAKTR